jgi:hypothetical protein
LFYKGYHFLLKGGHYSIFLKTGSHYSMGSVYIVMYTGTWFGGCKCGLVTFVRSNLKIRVWLKWYNRQQSLLKSIYHSIRISRPNEVLIIQYISLWIFELFALKTFFQLVLLLLSFFEDHDHKVCLLYSALKQIIFIEIF